VALADERCERRHGRLERDKRPERIEENRAERHARRSSQGHAARVPARGTNFAAPVQVVCENRRAPGAGRSACE